MEKCHTLCFYLKEGRILLLCLSKGAAMKSYRKNPDKIYHFASAVMHLKNKRLAKDFL